MKFFNKKRGLTRTYSKGGFTLIELLVVISIIALLSSVVLSSLNTARAKARDSKRIQDLLQIRNAIALYQADHNGAYPPSGQSCGHNGAVTGWTDKNIDGIGKELSPYITSLPVDPKHSDCIAGPSGSPYKNYYLFTTSGYVWPGSICVGKPMILAKSFETSNKRNDCKLSETGYGTILLD